MIKVQGIDHVAFNVRDLDKALKFYTDVIGLKITGREPSKPGIEYFLDCGSSLLGIIQAKDLTNSHLFANEGLGANHFSFRVHAQDFDGLIGIGRFDNFEPGLRDHIHRVHSKQKLVLHDQHHGSFGLNKTHPFHSPANSH